MHPSGVGVMCSVSPVSGGFFGEHIGWVMAGWVLVFNTACMTDISFKSSG